MSYANFKPTIWSKFIQNQLDQKAILTNFCNKKFEGEAKQGEQVWILNAPSPTIFDYDAEKRATGGGIGDPEQLEGTRIPLVLDQAKAFNFMIDDIDKMQTVDGLMESIMKEKARAMLILRERFVGELAIKAAENMIVPSAQIKTAAAAKAAVDAALLKLRNAGVDLDDNVQIVLCPFMYQLFRDYIMEIRTQNDGVVKNGVVGTYDNAQVVMSTNLYNDGTDDHCMVRTENAIAFASGIDKMEAYRPEHYFSDAIKGLNVYGGTLARPNELVTIKVHQ